ncbi:MAG: hypothetical protein F6K42_01185 [Leptolyngbya sp. SIO1D8]|nr:hypothetical protein [Leptolyngbya sp. SIO1D8]
MSSQCLSTAARELGLLDMKYTCGYIELFDGTQFEAEDPLVYLNDLAIKRDCSVVEVITSCPNQPSLSQLDIKLGESSLLSPDSV